MPWYDLSGPEGVIEHAEPLIVDHRKGEAGGVHVIDDIVHVVLVEEQQQMQADQQPVDTVEE